MQILESSVLGLRTARMVFRKQGSPVSFTLYQVVHVGEERFYDEVYAEAFSHDVALVEGVDGSAGRNLTRSDRWVDVEKLGLVVQPKHPPLQSVSARIVHADLAAGAFDLEWRKVPLWLRAVLHVMAPLFGLHRRLFATRESLIRKMSLEDLRSPDEILRSPALDAVDQTLLHVRDKRLLDCIAAELDDESDKRIAIVYGAAHMRAVISELTARGFRSAEASWRTIISLC